MQTDCIIREYRDADHAGLCRLVESFYGTGYPYPEFLDADALRKMQQAGDLILTVAVDTGMGTAGEVVGVVAAQRQHGAMEKTVVLKLRNVKEEYRKTGIATEQLNDLLERVHEKFGDALSIYADVMTHDSVSQRSLVRRGYTLTGLRLMQYTNAIMVSKLDFPPHTKMSQAIFCKKLCGESVSIAPPPVHRDWIGKIYADLGIACEWLSESGITAEKSEIEYHDSKRFAKAEWMIGRTGKDLIQRVADDIAAHTDCEDFSGILFLPMDGACAEAYEGLRSLGFYFSGIQPLTGKGEYMVLAKTDGCRENFEQIALADVGVDWLGYIRENKNAR